jgi:hypothetical protein
MNKKTREMITFLAAGIVIVILPILVLNYFGERRREMFYRHVAEDHEVCRERAVRDSRDAVWCDEIRSSAKLAYSEAESSNNLSPMLIMIQPLLFMLFISIYNLRKRVDQLKEKIDV